MVLKAFSIPFPVKLFPLFLKIEQEESLHENSNLIVEPAKVSADNC